MESVQVIKRTIDSDLPYNKKPSTRAPFDMLEEYNHLRNEMKKLGYKKRNEVMGGMNMREYIYKETDISQSQFNKLAYIQEKDPSQFKHIENGKKTIGEICLELKG